MNAQSTETKIPVGISSCLLGDSVRYNGGHKHSKYCTEKLSKYFDFHSFCPEMAIGLGVPREPIRLVGEWVNPRVVGTKDETIDVTEDLRAYANEVLNTAGNLRGYIFMKDSPSCGLFSTKVYKNGGVHQKKRAGLYADEIVKALPNLPVEEEGRLNDALLRENFIARVFLYHDWHESVMSDPTPASLVAFHSRQKYRAMSYSQSLYKELGHLVAGAGAGDFPNLCDRYISAFMQGTKKPASRKGHVNVLYHLVGYLKETVPGGLRQELTVAIEDYRKGSIALAVPMRLLQHYLENYASDYIKSQSYLNPHPYELGLRNAV